MTSAGYSGPTTQDYALLLVSVLFVAIGLFILPHKLDVGIVAIALFGLCSVVHANTIFRKRRDQQTACVTASVIGGVPIRPSRLRVAIMSQAIFGLGVVLVVFAKPMNQLLWYCGWFLVAVGAALLLGMIAGLVPVGYLRFDPLGLTVFYRGWGYTVPWDNIQKVAAGEVYSNPAAYIWIAASERVVPLPEAYRQKVFKHFDFSLRYTGAHLVLMTSNYGIDLPVFIAALERYITDPSTPAELAQPTMLKHGSDGQ
jgi:hypothetical protein